MAKELGVDINRIKGTGADGVITAEDVQGFTDAKAGSAAHAAIESEPLSAVARLMAERTTQSWTSVPHFFVSRDVDAAALSDFQKVHAAQFEKEELSVTITSNCLGQRTSCMPPESAN